MRQGKTLPDLIEQVKHNAKAKKDFVASTAEAIRLVEMPDFPNGVAAVLLKSGAKELERLEINETAHGQIAAHLGIPFKYYQRLLADHKDLVIQQVNALFQREPATRLIRTLDGHVRAFLSDRYARLDNDQILADTLPVLTADGAPYSNTLLSCNVTEERLDVKCLFTDPKLAFAVGAAPNGRPDIVKPGFHLGNSEVGKGSLFCKSFFYRDYCRNGAVYGSEEIFEYRRSHLGGKLLEGSNFQILSDETRKLDDKAIVSAVTDVMKTLANPEFIEEMAQNLRALKGGPKIEKPVDAISVLTKELTLTETESASALETLIRDRDYSRWGALNAVTALANDAPTYERANELEALANRVIHLPAITWERICRERVAA